MSEKTVTALHNVLELIKSFDDSLNGKQASGTDKDRLLRNQKESSIISLSDSDSSDSEFGDIIPRQRAVVQNDQPNVQNDHHGGRRVTNSGTILHLLKANISTGLLAMPKAMSHFGLLAGVLGILTFGSIYIYCIHLLLDMNRAIVKRVMLDRKLKEMKVTIVELCKKLRKQEKKEQKRMKNVAKDCASATEIAFMESKNLKETLAPGIEAGEPSSVTANSNGKTKNWKLKFSPDMEIGESSSTTADSSKSFTKLKEKDAKDDKMQLPTSNEKNANMSYTKLKPENAKDNKDRESSSSNENNSKKKHKGRQKLAKLEEKVTVDVEAESFSSDKDTLIKKHKGKQKLAKLEEKLIVDIEEESFSSDKDTLIKKNKGKKKLTKLDENQAEDINPITACSSDESFTTVTTEFEEEIKVEEIETVKCPPSNEDNFKNNTQEGKEGNTDEDVLIRCSEEIFIKTLDYPKLVELSFHYGLKSNKWASKFVKFYVQMLMLFTHIGCCCVCFLFVAETLGEVTTNGKFLLHYNSFQTVAYAIPIMICLSFIPDRHELTGVTTIAFLLQLIGVIMMIYFFFIGEHSEDLSLYIAPAETWYLYFGILFYAFEGTGVTLHLESHMEKKQDFRGWNGILNKSMFFIVPLYAVFGALGYWKFGNDVKTSITFNLPEERITDLIQVMTALGILLTYPFHLSFVLTPIKKTFIHDDVSDTTKNILDLVLRAGFVVFTFILSALTPYLELQLTVLGAVASCFLILCIPPFMSLNSYMFLPDLDYSSCRLLFHMFIMIVGMAGTTLGSYTTFKNLHLYYPNSTIFG